MTQGNAVSDISLTTPLAAVKRLDACVADRIARPVVRGDAEIVVLTIRDGRSVRLVPAHMQPRQSTAHPQCKRMHNSHH